MDEIAFEIINDAIFSKTISSNKLGKISRRLQNSNIYLPILKKSAPLTPFPLLLFSWSLMKVSYLLLILITVTLAGTLFFGIGPLLGNLHDFSPTDPIKIEVVSFSAGDRYNDSLRFQDNILILRHAGGSPVSLDAVSIQITGKGNVYSGIPGSGGRMIYGDVLVYYEHINSSRKNSGFVRNNRETLRDGLWSPGEILILTGNDSLNSTVSSVFASVNGNSDTSNNYGFSSNQTLEIRIYQKNRAGNPRLVLKKEAAV